MKVSLLILRLDLDAGPIMEARLPPGPVRHAFVSHAMKRTLLSGGQPQTESFPSLMLEVRPDEPAIRRRFLALPAGAEIDTAALQREMPDALGCGYVAAVINPNDGRPFLIFEIELAPEPVVDDSDRPMPVAGELVAP